MVAEAAVKRMMKKTVPLVKVCMVDMTVGGSLRGTKLSWKGLENDGALEGLEKVNHHRCL